MKLIPLKTVSYGKFGLKIVDKKKTVGKVYFDIKGNTFIIHYIKISKLHRKKGYAKKALKMLMKTKYKCFKTTSIAKSNTVSRKLFASLGFKEYKKGKYLYAKLCK